MLAKSTAVQSDLLNLKLTFFLTIVLFKFKSQFTRGEFR